MIWDASELVRQLRVMVSDLEDSESEFTVWLEEHEPTDSDLRSRDSLVVLIGSLHAVIRYAEQPWAVCGACGQLIDAAIDPVILCLVCQSPVCFACEVQDAGGEVAHVGCVSGVQ